MKWVDQMCIFSHFSNVAVSDGDQCQSVVWLICQSTTLPQFLNIYQMIAVESLGPGVPKRINGRSESNNVLSY